MMLQSVCSSCGSKKLRFIKNQEGEGFDIHKLIGKLPRPKKGWTPGKYKYMGPYNPLDKQLEYDKNTGEITKYYVEPYNEVDRIASQHDVDYSMCSSKDDVKVCKNKADRKMIQLLDQIPYGNMPKWGQITRFLINTKQKLGMGSTQPSKNLKSRRGK